MGGVAAKAQRGCIQAHKNPISQRYIKQSPKNNPLRKAQLWCRPRRTVHAGRWALGSRVWGSRPAPCSPVDPDPARGSSAPRPPSPTSPGSTRWAIWAEESREPSRPGPGAQGAAGTGRRGKCGHARVQGNVGGTETRLTKTLGSRWAGGGQEPIEFHWNADVPALCRVRPRPAHLEPVCLTCREGLLPLLWTVFHP